MSLYIWIGLLLFVVMMIFVYVKFRYILHKFHWIIVIMLALFLYLTFMVSIAGEGLNLTNMGDLKIAGDVYLSWLVNAFDNTKTLTANVIKMDWGIPNPFE
tara:strand:+ start:30779 stop:31081 length:303 start_codon:yes stop_codon:yes gene_type:complete